MAEVMERFDRRAADQQQNFLRWITTVGTGAVAVATILGGAALYIIGNQLSDRMELIEAQARNETDVYLAKQEAVVDAAVTKAQQSIDAELQELQGLYDPDALMPGLRSRAESTNRWMLVQGALMHVENGSVIAADSEVGIAVLETLADVGDPLFSQALQVAGSLYGFSFESSPVRHEYAAAVKRLRENEWARLYSSDRMQLLRVLDGLSWFDESVDVWLRDRVLDPEVGGAVRFMCACSLMNRAHLSGLHLSARLREYVFHQGGGEVQSSAAMLLLAHSIDGRWDAADGLPSWVEAFIDAGRADLDSILLGFFMIMKDPERYAERYWADENVKPLSFYANVNDNLLLAQLLQRMVSDGRWSLSVVQRAGPGVSRSVLGGWVGLKVDVRGSPIGRVSTECEVADVCGVLYEIYDGDRRVPVPSWDAFLRLDVVVAEALYVERYGRHAWSGLSASGLDGESLGLVQVPLTVDLTAIGAVDADPRQSMQAPYYCTVVGRVFEEGAVVSPTVLIEVTWTEGATLKSARAWVAQEHVDFKSVMMHVR
jgi:hypothetical protein